MVAVTSESFAFCKDAPFSVKEIVGAEIEPSFTKEEAVERASVMFSVPWLDTSPDPLKVAVVSVPVLARLDPSASVTLSAVRVAPFSMDAPSFSMEMFLAVNSPSVATVTRLPVSTDTSCKEPP